MVNPIITQLDELRAKWETLIESGKAEPEWKQKVTLNFTDKFNSKELYGLDLCVATFFGEVLSALPKLFDELPALRQAVLDGMKYKEAATALAKAVEEYSYKHGNDVHLIAFLVEFERTVGEYETLPSSAYRQSIAEGSATQDDSKE